MNIHFDDVRLLNDLTNNTVFKTKIGSHMYGLDNTLSDIDILSIYVEDMDSRNSFMWEHHQLQYNDGEEIDRLFTTLQSLIRNALTGDSTINFEVIQSGDLKNTDLHWLWERRHYFFNYNIIKSYLGFAKRDLKYWNKDTNRGKKHTDATNKKLSHFVRGILYAKQLMEGEFTFDLVDQATFSIDDHSLLVSIKNGELFENDVRDFKDMVNFFETMMNSLRKELNIRHDKKEIVTFMKADHLKELDDVVKNFVDQHTCTHFIRFIEYGDLMYNALENGVTY